MYPCKNEKYPFEYGQDAYVKGGCIFCNEDPYCPFKIKSNKSVERYVAGDTFDFSSVTLKILKEKGINPDNILHLKGVVFNIPDGSENDKYKVNDIIIYGHSTYKFDGRNWNEINTVLYSLWE